MMISVTQDYISSNNLIMNNEFQTMWKKWSWPNLRYNAALSQRGWGKPQETSVKMASVPAEI
jgi:hypothetical protein